MWRTPCCNREADDRLWVSSPAIRRIDLSQVIPSKPPTG